jgi:dynein heavy chain
VDPHKKETLSRFIGMNLEDKYAKLEEVSDSATKEFGIEKILDKVIFLTLINTFFNISFF